MIAALRFGALVGTLLCLAACGKPLADPSYQGEPKYRFQGRLAGNIGNDALVNPAVGVVWLGASGFLVGTVAGLTPVTSTSFPVDFQAAIFDDPPPGTRPWLNADFFQMISGIPATRGLRVGVIVAIDDVDKDGRVALTDEGSSLLGVDRFFGVATQRVLAYVDAEYESVTYQGIALKPGFHLLDPCYSKPKAYDPKELIGIDLFTTSRFLTMGTRGTADCPVVLFPQTRGPLQRVLAESEDCSSLCKRFVGNTCSVACGNEMCLRMVQTSRCTEAKVLRLKCLAQEVTTRCGDDMPDVDEGNCSDFNEVCAAARPEDAVALAQSSECATFCQRLVRATGAGACSGDCATWCQEATKAQPCLAAAQAQLACRSVTNEVSDCWVSAGAFGSVCLATAQFDHLCPSVF